MENKENQSPVEGEGLTYNTEIIGDLVNKDTDGDGVLDWEESLWGTDPMKKETTPGTSDSVAIEKLKAEQSSRIDGENTANREPGNLTQTDKFSRDLFATVTSLSQNGAIDQATVDQIGGSLADHIQNSPPRKVYLFSDIKLSANDNVQAYKNYSDALYVIHAKYSLNYTVLDVLQKFIIDENNVDSSVLTQLDPIITQANKIVDGMAKMSVPQSLALLHLDVINALQRLIENVSDIKLYEKDVIVSLSAIGQYDKNTNALVSTTEKLINAITQKLNS